MLAARRPRLIGGVSFLPFLFLSAAFPAEDQQASTTVPARAQAATASPSPTLAPLSDALALFRKGDFDGATQKYRLALRENPKSAEAYVGLTRVFLKAKDVQQASDTVSKALQVVDLPAVHVALGEVYVRQGKIGAAEQEWVKVINSGHPDARAYMGLARVRWAISLYKSGWTMIDKAHALDPSDPEIHARRSRGRIAANCGVGGGKRLLERGCSRVQLLAMGDGGRECRLPEAVHFARTL
jgi:Flp pilus assembly protein TadD